MKITIFYRSNEKSNAIVSSTKDSLWNNNMGVEVDYINLDKRNYKKYLDKCSIDNLLPESVYIFDDEEIVKDFIAENYPNIKIYDFNKKNSVKYGDSEYEYGEGGYKSYRLIDLIKENVKKELGYKKMFVIDGNIIKEKEISILGLKFYGNTIFEDKKSAIEYLISQIKQTLKYNIDYSEKVLKLIEAHKKEDIRLNREIKKLEKSLGNKENNND